MYTTAWCTCAALEGRTSTICTHLSTAKCVGTISYVYSTSPCAGICTGLGIFTTTCRGGGASRASPAGAPALYHAEIVAISPALNEGSLAKCPYRGSANHGGIIFISTAAAI